MSFAPQNDADAFLDNEGFGPRSASWKPSAVGNMVAGEVVDVRVMDATSIDTGELKKNPDGSIKKQLVVIIQTDLRNWAEATPLKDQSPQKNPLPPSEDDGKRAIYAEQSTNRAAAIKAAVAEKGLTGAPKPGGKLWIRLTEERNVGKPSPLKIFAAGYLPPAPGQAGADQFVQQTPQAGQMPQSNYQGYAQPGVAPQGFGQQNPAQDASPQVAQQFPPSGPAAQPGMQQAPAPAGYDEPPF